MPQRPKKEDRVIPREQWIEEFVDLLKAADDATIAAYRAVTEMREHTWRVKVEGGFVPPSLIGDRIVDVSTAAGESMTGVGDLLRLLEFVR